MDHDDSSARCFFNYIFILLVLLVQLDVLEYPVYNYLQNTTPTAYCASDNEQDGEEEAGESYYYHIRLLLTDLRLFAVTLPDPETIRLVQPRGENKPLYPPFPNRQTHAICCVYLI